MGYFLQSGDSFHPAPSKDALLDGLPAGVYTLEQSMSGWFYKKGEGFQKLPKLYGDMEKWQQKVLRSFADRPGNTGVLLSGEKGSGKSLLGRLISAGGAGLGMPTILINKHIEGSVLGDLLGQLASPAVVFMDEFEKVFNETSDQEEILGVLDGVHRSRHLFVLTVNDTNRMDRHLKNRPGRLYYHIEFQGLEASFVEDYCREHLANSEWIADVKRVAALFEAFNFDMLQALVEEVNRFDEPPLEAVRLLNITPLALEDHYTVTAFDSTGRALPIYQDKYFGSPLALRKYEVYFDVDTDDKDNLADWERELLGLHPSSRIMLTSGDLKECRVEAGIYEFMQGDIRVLFTREAKQGFSHWTAAF